MEWNEVMLFATITLRRCMPVSGMFLVLVVKRLGPFRLCKPDKKGRQVITYNRCAGMFLALATVFSLGCGEEPEEKSVRMKIDSVIEYDPHAFDDLREGVLKSYLKIQNALAHDRFEAAKREVIGLHTFLPPNLSDAAQSATDIKQLRADFLRISNYLIDSELPDDYTVAYCSMAFDYSGGHWIQKAGEIMNPYYGSGMLHCGVFVDSQPNANRSDH